jgi:hypothetical protein
VPFQSGPLFGIRYQVRASGPLSVEASLGVSPTDRRLFTVTVRPDSTFGEPVDLETTVPATIVMADVGLRFHLTGPRTWNGLAPFVVGSGGIVGDARGTFEEEEEDVREEAFFRFGPSFAVGAGVGTDWFPSSNACIRIEAGGRLGRGRADRVDRVVPVDLIVGRVDPAGAGLAGLAAGVGRSLIRWWA